MLAGFAGAYPGFLEADNKFATTLGRRLQNQDLQDQLAGRQALGNALAAIFQANQNPNLPMAPPPGTMSQPQDPWAGIVADRPNLPPAPDGFAPGPQGPQPPPNVPMPAPTSMPLSTSPAGRVSWADVVNNIHRSNPNISGSALAAAVEKYLPIMSQQAQQEYREMMLALREQNAQTRLDIANLRDNRAQQNEAGRNQRAQDTNDIRRANEAGRNDRAANLLKLREEQFNTKEGRLERALELRMKGFEEVVKRNARNAESQDRNNALRQMTALNTQLFQAQRNRILAARDMTGDERRVTMAEAQRQYEDRAAQIEKLSAGPEQAPAAAPAARPRTQAPAAQELPAAAKAQLKEGQITTFGNGQKWKLTNGVPERVE